MKILIACDKFKGSLDATQVCQNIATGIHKKYPYAQTQSLPLADGGDGTLSMLEKVLDVERIKVPSVDPLNRPIQSYYLSNGKTAYIELATTSGFELLHSQELDVMNTNTFGTGLLLKDALQNGHHEIILALGGSCTNDVGLGILEAMGYIFKDKNNAKISPNGGSLIEIESIVVPSFQPSFQLTILHDVENLLFGKEGAAFTFAAQKGASDLEIKILDDGMQHIAKILKTKTGKSIQKLKGGGAAGGIAAGLYGFLKNVVLQNGFEYLSKLNQLEEQIKNCDVMITGEGQLDTSSFNGKVVGKIVELCQKHQKFLKLFVGRNALSNKLNYKNTEIYSLEDVAKSKEDSMQYVKEYLTQIASSLELKME